MVNKMLSSRPLKMWIDGKIYHINQLNRKARHGKNTQLETTEELDSEELSRKLEIKEENGTFVTSFRLPKLYYAKIQRMPQFNIEKLSKETNTKITLPKLLQDGELSIQSEKNDDLIEAVRHVHLAVAEIRDQNIPLQFICIPCLNEKVKERFEHLKSEIMAMQGEIDGLHESIFMCPLKLHITIDVYALLSDEERGEAVEALEDYKGELEKVLETTGPLKLNISGLDIMNDDVKKVNVLYAKIKLANESDEYNLQRIVNDISNHFYDRGLAKKYQDNIKLHMTIINTKYRKNSDSPKRKRKRQSIDATKILEKFKDYNFGDCNFDSLHLSHISMKGEDGFYKPLHVIKLDCNKDFK